MAKYFAFREIIARHRPGVEIPEPPASSQPISFPPVELKETAPLFENLGRGIPSDAAKPMEQYGQSYGYILYRTHLAAATQGELRLKDLRDYAVVFVNGARVGTLDRRMGEDAVTVDVPANATLDVLVENTGRVNFGKGLRDERSGISGATLNGEDLRRWTVYPLPMNDLRELRFATDTASGPAFYRATLSLTETGDTFFDCRRLGKGVAWINGRMLGRFWNIGPQQTLYVPGPWLRKGKNEIVIFDLEGGTKKTVQGLAQPILDQLQ
jgi:beta-galactosidase